MSSILKKVKKAAAEETTAIRYCAGVVTTPLGFISIVFQEGTDPMDLLLRAADGESVPGIAGPFETEQEAKACGSAMLTAAQEKLREAGIESYRGLAGKA